MVKKTKEKKAKQEVEVKDLKGKCLSCKKPLGKNKKKCCACLRKERLKRKANREGKERRYYLR